MKKRFLAMALTGVMAVTALTACESTPGGSSSADSSINVCIGSEPDTIDPALNSAVDGATLLVHLYSGLSKWEMNDSGVLEIVPDAAVELPEGVENADGTITYTYTLRDGLKWSDGQDLKASDFVYAWNRAASAELAADYGYMFEVVDGYNEVADVNEDGTPANPDAKLNVQAPDDKTIVVTLYNPVSYWNELLAFPTYFPVREDVVSNEAWATDPSTYVCNGPYKMASWEHNSLITLEKNDSFVDADQITMNTINFYLSDDQNNMLTNFKNGDWQLIDDIPTNEIASVKSEFNDQFVIAGQLGTYYVCWNVNEDILPAGSPYADDENAKAEIRRAVGLLFDRNYIVNDVAQGGELPASSFVSMGLTDADGSQFYKNVGVSSDFDGYYNVSADAYTDNFNEAVEILKKYYTYDETSGKFTDFPVLTYIYNTSEGHKAIGEYLQNAMAGIGITMNLENQEWATFLNTRKDGAYSIARNGWLADYNDPICFLDMWTTDSGNNDVQFGRGDHADDAVYSIDLTPYGFDTKVENGTWAETYDVLISSIKSCTDNDNRYKMMHEAEDMIMSTGCICPLYFYTDMYLLSDKVDGFFSNPLGYKYFMYTTIK
ncbi:MAG: peptide ABC transporter substrate-binding protein [Lachnospiraceae bacterium]|nr:peptide ABC transporter substrate-binding protein [Lachnospiraceae bacterium]